MLVLRHIPHKRYPCKHIPPIVLRAVPHNPYLRHVHRFDTAHNTGAQHLLEPATVPRVSGCDLAADSHQHADVDFGRPHHATPHISRLPTAVITLANSIL
jgi:hypothetical protein